MKQIPLQRGIKEIKAKYASGAFSQRDLSRHYGIRQSRMVGDRAYARTTDGVHSHEAAASVINIGPTKEGILQVLRLYGPSTDERIALMYRGLRAMGKQLPESSPSGLRSRRAWLVDHGFVVEAGTGKTASGRACTIWRLK